MIARQVPQRRRWLAWLPWLAPLAGLLSGLLAVWVLAMWLVSR